MNEKCCVLLLSCDKNIDVVKSHLFFLEKQWPDCPFAIFVSLESAKLDYSGTLNIHVLHSNSKYWSKRVMEHIQILPAEYLMITLDDFFIEDTVKTDKVLEALLFLKEKKNAANVALVHFIGNKQIEKNRDWFECRVKNRPCLLNWQIGLWRKEALLTLLIPEENPWQSELYGSLRARYLSNYDFYCIDNDSNMPLLYNRGWLIVRGKWNLNEVRRIEQKCGIAINPTNRPIEPITKIKEKFCKRVENRVAIIRYQIKLIIKRKRMKW